MNNSTSILIIEDDPLLAEHLSQHLKKEGFEICGVAENYQTASELIKKQTIDIALVDIKLNGPENGIVIATQLLKNKSIPIIYITGESSDEIVEKCKDTNPAAFLVKPLNMKEVVIQVKIAEHNLKQGNFIPNATNTLSDNVYLPCNKGYLRIRKKEIAYIMADRTQSKIFLTRNAFDQMSPNKPYTFLQASTNMGKILEKLPANFQRLSRSLTVNLNHIDLVNGDSMFIEQREIVIPEGARSSLLELLDVIKTR